MTDIFENDTALAVRRPITVEQWKRLPRYVRRYIAKLEHDVVAAKAKLHRMADGDTDVFIGGLYPDESQPLPPNTIIEWAGDRFAGHARIGERGRLHIYADRALDIRPVASNHVEIQTGSD